MWVSSEKKYMECIRCEIPGTPLNEGAEKMLRKEGLYGENIS